MGDLLPGFSPPNPQKSDPQGLPSHTSAFSSVFNTVQVLLPVYLYLSTLTHASFRRFLKCSHQQQAEVSGRLNSMSVDKKGLKQFYFLGKWSSCSRMETLFQLVVGNLFFFLSFLGEQHCCKWVRRTDWINWLRCLVLLTIWITPDLPLHHTLDRQPTSFSKTQTALMAPLQEIFTTTHHKSLHLPRENPWRNWKGMSKDNKDGMAMR